MEFHLFDNHSLRQKTWSKICENHALPLLCFEAITQLQPVRGGETRIMLFEEATIGDCLSSVGPLLTQLRSDIVAFSISGTSASTASRIIRNGAHWVFDVESSPRELEIGLRQLLIDAADLTQQVLEWKLSQQISDSLNSGEREVLELVLTGIPNHQIAAQLCISVRTVEARRAKVYRKCEVSNITDLVRFIEKYERLQRRFQVERKPQPQCR